MTPKPPDELYFTWLYGQVAPVTNRKGPRSYWRLLRELYTKEFVWLIANDDNRMEDGEALRHEFLSETETSISGLESWLGLPCSFLEMLIALSRRLAFESEVESEVKTWFWHLITNLDLIRCNDLYLSGGGYEESIAEVTDRVIWRQYLPDGQGGLFPLRNPDTDQRHVEIWYQLNAYIMENE